MKTHPKTWRLALAATGVVFGDIGTSPLYAFRESFVGHHRLPLDEPHVLGVLSLLVWALILVVTVKYVLITMRADNRGEGGSFALLALIKRVAGKSPMIPAIATAALIATALFYGDAMITPAISILSAVEGLTLADPRFAVAVLPVTLVIVAGLFLIQRWGTGVIGALFGPVMVLWFVVIAVLGGLQVLEHPLVLKAVSPTYAIGFIVADPVRAFFTLGTVVLAVTGAEALFADMGHFGRKPIARAWLCLALPALLLCYAGQSALVLGTPSAIRSPFYLMAPAWGLIPLIVLASVATVIASQSIISGAFSVTQQAVRLGYAPRLQIRHTSGDSMGQIYAPAVNGALYLSVTALVIGFGSSSALAAAFGLAVTATMVLTTLLIGFVIFRIWRWNPLWAAPLYALLLACDIGLFAASATKFGDGGWLPVSVALLLVLLFATWRKGRALVTAELEKGALPVDVFLATAGRVTRAPGLAVYLTSSAEGVPPALLHNLKHNHVLHARVYLLTVETALSPTVGPKSRVQLVEMGGGIARVALRYGFMQEPDVPAGLQLLCDRGERIEPLRTTYFLSRQIVVPSKRPGMALWREHLFAAMSRNAATPMTTFNLPVNRVIELGSQLEI
ncbi:KUP/HAK/KT family potassium transporter (plasmid) [Phenylobacterium sp. LH3H17]|uniref:potassium transporter Kup n=1 Tax=Phenylobacterium sp. LH3H17 TaxID=2903901 RepID=UPI0020CA1151|nr:KUP/HAK/KT family potassium transporter [Phenylobacterium sp. LH3H17]UTP41712.1 KUP/HAK/KT family potassium transporter [Phenylobacterium sp. LH3H17]